MTDTGFRSARIRLQLAVAIVLVTLLAACGSPSVVPSATALPSVSPTPELTPSPSPSPSSSDSPSPSPTASPSPSPSPTPVPPLALTHCAGKSSRPSSTAIFSTQKLFAGYLGFGTTKTVTCVEASWVQPEITCAAGDSKADMSVYVGIGGNDGHGTTGVHERFEQAASEAYCDNGIRTYIAWTYAVQPKNGYTQAPFLIRPGDQIWAQVTASGQHFKMTIADLTERQITSVSTTIKDASRDDAQWTVESPEYGCPKHCAPGPLAKFGTVRFSGVEAVIAGILATVDREAHQATTMATGSIKRATVSKLGHGSFTVTWHHS